MGQGAMRTAGETLGTQGVSHSATIVAALRWVYRYEQGLMRERHLPLANDELVDMLPKHPEIVHSFPVAAKAHKLAAPSLVTALHYLCSQRDKATADEFFDKFADGYGLKAGHVVLVLRRRLWREAYKRHAVVRGDHKAL